MVDSASLYDLEGRKIPDLFGMLASFWLIIVITDLQFTGFRLGELGTIVTATLFITALIAGFGYLNILFTEGNFLDGVFGFTIGSVSVAGLADLSNLNFSFLSQASNSYLSGILPENAGILIDLVNKPFASIGETFLIFSFSKGIHTIVEETRLKQLPFVARFLIVSVPPSFIFAVLHGATQLQFFLFAFTINMVWTGIMYWGELREDGLLDPVPVGLGLIAGIHFGNNLATGGGYLPFIAELVGALGGDYGRSAAVTLVFLAITLSLGFYRLFQVLTEEVEIFG